MDHQRGFPWVLAWLLVAAPMARAQIQETNVSVPVTADDWNRLRVLTSALTTEEGTRSLFARSPRFGGLLRLAGLLPFFRSSLAAAAGGPSPESGGSGERGGGSHTLPAGRQQSSPDLPHELPKNAITIVTSVWQGDVLVKLAFMKGFANVVLGPTPGSQGIWRGASRRGYSD